MSTRKPYTPTEARELVAEEDASSAPSWPIDSPRFIATAVALDVAVNALKSIDYDHGGCAPACTCPAAVAQRALKEIGHV